MRYLLYSFCAVLLAMLLVAGYNYVGARAGSSSPLHAEEEEEEVEVGEGGGTIAIPVKPTQIDPQAAPNAGLDAILPYLFDTLVVRDSKDDLVPSLAKSWELEQDGKAVTMRLRDDVFFHDGTALNAEAVKFTFERFKTSGKASLIYNSIMGISETEAVDNFTVRFTLNEPIADFWDALTSPSAGIISPESADLAARTGSGEMVGSGPFMRADTDDDQTITLTRYVGYHWGPAVTQNRDATFIENIVFRIIPDSNTQVAALENGKIDAIYVTQSDQWLELQEDSSIQLLPTYETKEQGAAVANHISGVKLGGLGQMLLNDAKIQGADAD